MKGAGWKSELKKSSVKFEKESVNGDERVPRGINGFNYYLIKMRKKWSRSGARLTIFLSPAHYHPFLKTKIKIFLLIFKI